MQSESENFSIEEYGEEVELIKLGDKSIYLVKTAHISKRSAEVVEEVIRKIKPEAVCVELCENRLEAIKNPDRWRELDIFNVIKEGKAYVLFSQLALSSFQKRLADKYEIAPGEEMRVGIRLAQDVGAKLCVIDRDVKITLKRAWSKASLWIMLKMFFGLIFSMFSREEIAEEEIERLKHGDALENALGEFSKSLPQVKEVLIDERDSYMAAKLSQLKEKNSCSRYWSWAC